MVVGLLLLLNMWFRERIAWASCDVLTFRLRLLNDDLYKVVEDCTSEMLTIGETVWCTCFADTVDKAIPSCTELDCVGCNVMCFVNKGLVVVAPMDVSCLSTLPGIMLEL